MLLSSVGTAGLNLDFVNVLIIVDTLWSVMDDLQLQGCLKCYPQNKGVEIYRLIAARTADETICMLSTGTGKIHKKFTVVSLTFQEILHSRVNPDDPDDDPMAEHHSQQDNEDKDDATAIEKALQRRSETAAASTSRSGDMATGADHTDGISTQAAEQKEQENEVARAQLEHDTLERLKLDVTKFVELLDIILAVHDRDATQHTHGPLEDGTSYPPPPWSSERIMAVLPNITASTLSMHSAFKQSSEYLMLSPMQKHQYTKAINMHNKSTNASAKSPATIGKPPAGQPTSMPDRTSKSPEMQGHLSQPPTPPHPPEMLTSLGPHNEPDIWCPSGTPAGPLPPVLFQLLLSEEDIRAMNAMDEDGREHYLEQLRVAAKDCVAEKAEWSAWSAAAALKAANLQALDEKNTQSRALQEKLRALLHEQAANPVATSSGSQEIGLAGNVEPINTQDGEALDNTEQQHSQEDHTLGFEDDVDQTRTDNTEEISAGTKCGAGAMSPLQLTAKSKHKFNPTLGPEPGSSPVVLVSARPF
ncbi:hypothetical protein FIBSPDRAFT_942682 [Athelia psychrophila]|uniref:Helicase C-terminal domain-containing protein n=1 Tax=Athelia psychrophila TaxID=1759441 RepID=A0A166XA17_9AGAM|nr:hypothetical protein FIBSPDRAFT_942682 [Fibularhizoctonia sp. CBS 109695]